MELRNVENGVKVNKILKILEKLSKGKVENKINLNKTQTIVENVSRKEIENGIKANKIRSIVEKLSKDIDFKKKINQIESQKINENKKKNQIETQKINENKKIIITENKNQLEKSIKIKEARNVVPSKANQQYFTELEIICKNKLEKIKCNNWENTTKDNFKNINNKIKLFLINSERNKAKEQRYFKKDPIILKRSIPFKKALATFQI